MPEVASNARDMRIVEDYCDARYRSFEVVTNRGSVEGCASRLRSRVGARRVMLQGCNQGGT